MMLLTLAAGCAPASTAGPSPTSVLGRIRTKGELVVGTAASMPPLNMTTKTGEIIGLEIDLAQAMAKATLVSTKDYDEAIILLLQDKVDAMIADLPACLFAVRRYPDRGLYALETPLTYEPIGIALSGNDPLLLNWTQNWLRELETTCAL